MNGASILVINAGSSSIKLAVYDAKGGTPSRQWSGQVEGVGLALALTVKRADGTVVEESRRREGGSSHEDAFAFLLDAVFRHVDRHTLAAVSHRVVHGGRVFQAAVRIDGRVLALLEDLVPLAPLHQPHNLRGMRIIADMLPDLPQVACFDTAFHRTMPAVATRWAIPRDLEQAGVLRYGFHGLSYDYIAAELCRQAPEIADGRVIVAHLGNGASLCALRGGRSIETTMSFTPLDGLVMGTRCGTIDAGVVLFLLRQRGLSLDAVEDLLYRKSGLLGLSGSSSDLRALLDSADPSAIEAIDLYVYRICQAVGALTASLGGLDALVFTAGVGEHAARIRARIGEGSAWLGMAIDRAANEAGAMRIHAPGSKVAVLRIPTDEESVIVRQTLALLDSAAAEAGGS